MNNDILKLFNLHACILILISDNAYFKSSSKLATKTLFIPGENYVFR